MLWFGLIDKLISTSDIFLPVSHAVSNSYGTEIEIWANSVLAGNIEKNLGQLWATFDIIFSSFQGQKTISNFFLKIL